MKFTLLEGVQEILSAMDSDEVNSINDTVESYQVALIFRSVFYDLYNDLNLIEHKTTFGLEASGDTELPCVMTVPSTVTKIDWIKYNNQKAPDTAPHYEDVAFKEFRDFLKSLQVQDQTNITTSEITGDNGDVFTVGYWTDRMPKFYTFINDTTILFDAIDLSVETTLQQSKVLCEGSMYPTFDLIDEFTPDLDPSQFRYYINRVKVRAFAELKQAQNAEATSEARIQKIRTQNRKHRVASRPAIFSVAARYGRK